MTTRLSDARGTVILLACVLSFAAGGCAKKTVHAAAPATAPASAEAGRPMNIAPDTDASPPAETVAAPPTLPAPSTPPPAPVTIPAPRPAAPRRPAGDQPAAESQSEPATHAPAPQISPQLSPTDQASYARKIEEDTSVAEKNLQETSGKQLNAAQQDLVGKIRSFLSQSREASKDGDWARAQNLAQKARLLSNELINSF
jgi:type IV secretory pathway VirB10-like protein